MRDLATALKALRRPQLLIRAARFGLVEYSRSRDLNRLMADAPTPEIALQELISLETELEATRKAGGSDYSAARHIDILTALMGEARLLTVKP